MYLNFLASVLTYESVYITLYIGTEFSIQVYCVIKLRNGMCQNGKGYAGTNIGRSVGGVEPPWGRVPYGQFGPAAADQQTNVISTFFIKTGDCAGGNHIGNE
jgi:hypothetical protein